MTLVIVITIVVVNAGWLNKIFKKKKPKAKKSESDVSTNLQNMLLYQQMQNQQLMQLMLPMQSPSLMSTDMNRVSNSSLQYVSMPSMPGIVMSPGTSATVTTPTMTTATGQVISMAQQPMGINPLGVSQFGVNDTLMQQYMQQQQQQQQLQQQQQAMLQQQMLTQQGAQMQTVGVPTLANASSLNISKIRPSQMGLLPPAPMVQVATTAIDAANNVQDIPSITFTDNIVSEEGSDSLEYKYGKKKLNKIKKTK